jgi:ATP-dependent protease HslVU (ClpYQ) peptidase subunit
MTCEVAVMNKRGVALAADSAVTLGEGEKIFHTAEKLFQLSGAAPIGVMTCGSADIMGVPWETVIKLYRQKRLCENSPGSERTAR